jgi:hypothetical protein
VSSSWPESLSYQTDRRDADTNSEILKTGSSSTSEHCVLEFLVRVRDLDDLQILMDRLLDANSVMSVERRVSNDVFDEHFEMDTDVSCIPFILFISA